MIDELEHVYAHEFKPVPNQQSLAVEQNEVYQGYVIANFPKYVQMRVKHLLCKGYKYKLLGELDNKRDQEIEQKPDAKERIRKRWKVGFENCYYYVQLMEKINNNEGNSNPEATEYKQVDAFDQIYLKCSCGVSVLSGIPC